MGGSSDSRSWLMVLIAVEAIGTAAFALIIRETSAFLGPDFGPPWLVVVLLAFSALLLFSLWGIGSRKPSGPGLTAVLQLLVIAGGVAGLAASGQWVLLTAVAMGLVGLYLIRAARIADTRERLGIAEKG